MRIGNCKLSMDTLIALIFIIIMEWSLFIHAIIKGFEIVHYVLIPFLAIAGCVVTKFNINYIKEEEKIESDSN